jgi:hypothetical protein
VKPPSQAIKCEHGVQAPRRRGRRAPLGGPAGRVAGQAGRRREAGEVLDIVSSSRLATGKSCCGSQRTPLVRAALVLDIIRNKKTPPAPPRARPVFGFLVFSCVGLLLLLLRLLRKHTPSLSLSLYPLFLPLPSLLCSKSVKKHPVPKPTTARDGFSPWLVFLFFQILSRNPS